MTNKSIASAVVTILGLSSLLLLMHVMNRREAVTVISVPVAPALSGANGAVPQSTMCDSKLMAADIGLSPQEEVYEKPLASSSVVAAKRAPAATLEELAEFAAKIAESGEMEDILALFAAIETATGDDRVTLARSLQALSAPDLGPALLAFLMRHVDDPIVAEQAQTALARIIAPEDIAQVTQAMPSADDQQLLRSYLVGTLAKINNPAAVSELTKLCACSKDPDVCAAVSSALGAICTPEAVTSLVSLIQQSGQEDMNAPLAQALMAAANKDSSTLLQGEFMDTTNSVVKYATAYALTALKNQSTGTAEGIPAEQP